MYTYMYIYIHRNRNAFYLLDFFSKSYLNDVFCNNANQFILTC